jgi:two-component system OmpR family sensor kinase
VIAPSRQLLLRIYAVSLAQLLAIAGTIALVGWLTFKSDPHSGFMNEARYAVSKVAEHAGDGAAMRRELRLIRRLASAKLTVYGPAHNLVDSNVLPALRPLDEAEYQTLLAEGMVHGAGPPPLIALPLHPSDAAAGYVVYRHARPPPPPTGPVLWALAIALIGAALASMLLARSFVTPLSLLATAARKLGAGDLTARVRSQRHDEFGQLADTFDDMADRLTLVLRSQQELLANVSHELRTPLARIRVALDLAAEGDATTAQESLQEINEDLGELERLVADVLQTAKLDLAAGRAGAPLPLGRSQPVDVTELLGQVVQRFHAAHPERVLNVNATARFPKVTGDPVLLRRALDNLVDNARAYSDAPIQLLAEHDARELRLSVIDHGIGIAESDLAKVATPFFRTDPSRARRTGGLGLGLSLARKIVEAHGGTLSIESQLDHGTTIRIALPVAV